MKRITKAIPVLQYFIFLLVAGSKHSKIRGALAPLQCLLVQGNIVSRLDTEAAGDAFRGGGQGMMSDTDFLNSRAYPSKR